MIPFFRKIRKKMADENRPMKYLRYAIGEILLVVIGILIALQINNANENRKTNQIKQSYYQQLLEDLDQDKIYIQEQINYLDSSRAEYNAYLETFKQPNLELSEAINNLMNVNFLSILLSFQTNTIESLENTGDIKLIPVSLRNKLIDLKKIKDHTVLTAFTNDEHKSNLMENFSLEIGGITLIERLKNQPNLRESINPEDNYPKLFYILEAVQSWRKVTEMGTLVNLKAIQEKNNALIELIKIEIKK